MSRLDDVKQDEPVVPVDPSRKRKAYIAFIVDESGSMSSGREATMRGMNEQIQMIKTQFKDSTDVEPIVSVIKFNQTVNPMCVNKTLNDLIEFTEKSYQPNGMTAMYDAVGYMLNQFEISDGINDDDTTVLMVVVSDGEENSSKEHTSEKISERIKTWNETKRWTITYLGANQDLTVVSQKTNIHSGNTMSFDSTNNSTYSLAFAVQTKGMSNYLSNISSSKYKVAACTTDFYAEPKNEPEINSTTGKV